MALYLNKQAGPAGRLRPSPPFAGPEDLTKARLSPTRTHLHIAGRGSPEFGPCDRAWRSGSRSADSPNADVEKYANQGYAFSVRIEQSSGGADCAAVRQVSESAVEKFAQHREAGGSRTHPEASASRIRKVAIADSPLETTFAHGRASNTKLKGVSAARRKRVKPAAVTTLRMRSSPACAPRAAPTSCAREAGVQIMVDAE
jgi:hypothetical protein